MYLSLEVKRVAAILNTTKVNKSYFSKGKQSIQCLNADWGMQSKYSHVLTFKYNLKRHLLHHILNIQMSIIIF